MARELHDTTAQNLVAALLDVDRLPQLLPTLDEASQELLDEVRILVDRSLQELRTLSYLLHPPLLDELGLASALPWYVRGFESRSGITVSLTVQKGIGRMPAAVESALFRTVQEALTNIHRHSGSATADIRLTLSRGEVMLQIRDQGRGMPVDASSGGADMAKLGVGISGMTARLLQLGGKLEIQSTPKGTIVTATVSLDILRSISVTDHLTRRISSW
jgi:signal transduction histidine kinase